MIIKKLHSIANNTKKTIKIDSNAQPTTSQLISIHFNLLKLGYNIDTHNMVKKINRLEASTIINGLKNNLDIPDKLIKKAGIKIS